MRFFPATLVALALAGCGHTPVLRPVSEPRVELISVAYGMPEIRAAIIRALASRKFAPEREEPGRIIAKYTRGGQAARVTIEYTATQFLIRYVESDGIPSRTDPSGLMLVDEVYEKWVTALDKTIQ
ncbi:MAG TPA: hypothetical protein VHB21_14865, partial [Minicystis sp.]|nr:hypothetical protein [Minicystis sp.]